MWLEYMYIIDFKKEYKMAVNTRVLIYKEDTYHTRSKKHSLHCLKCEAEGVFVTLGGNLKA